MVVEALHVDTWSGNWSCNLMSPSDRGLLQHVIYIVTTSTFHDTGLNSFTPDVMFTAAHVTFIKQLNDG